MSASLHILAFELRYHARRASTHVYFGIFFFLGAFFMLLQGGGLASFASAGGPSGLVWANSTTTMLWVVPLLGMFGVLVTAPLMGRAVQRDFGYRMHPLLFSQPISRHAYLGGRFLGAALANAYVFAGIPLGLMIASLLPVMQPERMGPFRLDLFTLPYLVVLVPNILFTGAVFFSLAVHTRRMLPTYVAGVAMLAAYSLASGRIDSVENLRLVALLDPFGLSMMSAVSRYWTTPELNTHAFPVGGVVLMNRAVWLFMGAVFLATEWWRFRFVEVKEGGRRVQATPPPLPKRDVRAPLTPLPAVARSFTPWVRLRQYLSLTRVAFLVIVRDVYFLAITAAGVVLTVPGARTVDMGFGTHVYPTTFRVLRMLDSQFMIFVLIVAALYAGELVWRDRELQAHEVTDAMPVSTGALLLAKLTALAGALAVMLAILVPFGIAVQLFFGYHRFQIGLYLGTLFGMRLPQYLLIGGLALAVHAILNHKHLAHLVVIVGIVATVFLPQMGIEHALYRFGSSVGDTYSDLLGYANQLAPFYLLKAYWAGWIVLLLVAALLLWVRGEDPGWRLRLRAARSRARRGHAFVALGAVALIAGAGGIVFYNINVLNDYVPTREARRRAADYERTYGRYADAAGPEVARIELMVEIFPRDWRAEIVGTQNLLNRSEEVVDTLRLFFDPLVEVKSIEVSGATPGPMDALHGFHAYVFDRPLAPGDSAVVRYALEVRHRGFTNSEGTFQVRPNGSLLDGGYLEPMVGYDRMREVRDAESRRRIGLPPREGLPDREAPGATGVSYVGLRGWTDFAASVGTDADQVVVAPGDLVRRWSQDGRAYFRFESRNPIVGFAVASGDWQESRSRWREVDIAVYHHPAHGQNVPRMVQAVQETLEYCTSQFGPYPFGHVSIVELPRLGGGQGASALPGMIPYGEDAGFSSQVEEEDIDLPRYVTAHEVAHMWWAHQEMPALAKGGPVLAESLAQYTALMVMKRHFGSERVRRFLRYELDNYLRERTRAGRGEMPLALSDEGYTTYQKGSLVMFALQERLGEEQVNRALRDLLNHAQPGSPPYLTTLDLMRELRAVTPDSLQGFLEDAFDRIVLYDNRVSSAEATHLGGGRYAVRIVLQAHKMLADSTGLDTEVPMDDLVDFVVYGPSPGRGEERPVLRSWSQRVITGETVIDLEVDARPERVILDPFYMLMDRTVADNERRVELRGAPSEATAGRTGTNQ